MNSPLILGIGEIFWDLLPTGRRLGGAPAIFDINLRQHCWNRAVIESSLQLANVLTSGRRGSAIWHAGHLHAAAGQPVAVADTAGAGDAFCAALAMGLLAQLGAAQTLDLAQRAGTYVCTRPGTTPPLPVRLRLALAPASP